MGEDSGKEKEGSSSGGTGSENRRSIYWMYGLREHGEQKKDRQG